jgi:GGDEF domain-containing protein
MQLLHHADEAMYIAKRQGKNRAMPWARAAIS